MREYKDCYVAFLDMLGFKKMIEKKTCAEILDIYGMINRPVNKLIVNGSEIPNIDNVQLKVMSDSICFYIDSNIENALPFLVLQCLVFQMRLASLPEPIFVRGAITKGNLYAEGDVTFGPAITQAYLMEENNAKYPRIIMLGETIEQGKSNCGNDMYKVFEKYVFQDEDEFFTIDIFKVFIGADKDGTQTVQLMEYVEKVLSSTYDSSIREKYLYVAKNLRKNLINQ